MPLLALLAVVSTDNLTSQKPIVALLLLPPPASTTSTVPVIRLPEGYRPTPDPWANLKKYSGRVLDRIIGYTWWLLTLLGAGHLALGIANLVLSFGVWRLWRSRTDEGYTQLP